MTEKWEEYRGYTFRLEKPKGRCWRTFLRYPDGTPVTWSGVFMHNSEYTNNFDGITTNRVIKKVKRWIDFKIDATEVMRWP